MLRRVVCVCVLLLVAASPVRASDSEDWCQSFDFANDTSGWQITGTATGGAYTQGLGYVGTYNESTHYRGVEIEYDGLSGKGAVLSRVSVYFLATNGNITGSEVRQFVISGVGATTDILGTWSASTLSGQLDAVISPPVEYDQVFLRRNVGYDAAADPGGSVTISYAVICGTGDTPFTTSGYSPLTLAGMVSIDGNYIKLLVPLPDSVFLPIALALFGVLAVIAAWKYLRRIVV